jgi:uncharacterized UBP type Zn finger protein
MQLDTPQVTEAHVLTLMGMGYSRALCVQALIASDGNVEAAAALLPDL